MRSLLDPVDNLTDWYLEEILHLQKIHIWKSKTSRKLIDSINLQSAKSVTDFFLSITFFAFFFYLDFLSRTFANHRTAGEGGGHFCNSSLLLPPASRALRHWPGDYCRELTFAHSWQPDSNREPLVSERKSLTTKLRALRQCMPFWLQFLLTYFQTQKNLPIFTTFDWRTKSAKKFFENNEKKIF